MTHTAGSPTEESLIWTNLTKIEITNLMQNCGSYVSVHIVDQLLDRHGFHQRKALRMEPLARHPDRNCNSRRSPDSSRSISAPPTRS